MNVRRIVAPTIEEAMEKVRKQLGENAIILSSRKERLRGLRGLFGRHEVVITAVAEGSGVVRENFEVQKEALLKAIRQAKQETAMSESIALSPGVETAPAFSHGQRSSIELAEVMEKLTALEALQLAQSGLQPFRPEFRAWAKRLQASGMSLKTIYRLYTSHQAFIFEEEASIQEHLKTVLYETIRSKIVSTPSKEAWAAFIGPTGVGKTTTIAKLAALAKLERQLPVALLTIDTYRIAAVEQLRTYADILHIPFAVTYTPQEFEETLKRWLEEGYYVLIDTAGRNYFEDMHVQGLKDYMNRLDALSKKGSKYLVTSLTTRDDDISRLIRLFQPLGFRKLIFTKYDEAPQAGRIVELLFTHRIRLSYLTTGQNVPDDVRVADTAWLIHEVLGEGGR
ncbi:MAG: flagellar biosynthesis protein FlhF [Candidatus Carbobacillus sp.]|nr:flagellar biosynthesis protein FlhF [Candidatus Carbobacillus sp.]